MPRGKKAVDAGALGAVRKARESARNALQQLRADIERTEELLEKLRAEEQNFRDDLFGDGATAPTPKRRGRKPGPKPGATKAKKSAPRRKGPPKAQKYFEQLGKNFTIEDVRKLAGKATAISIAQWKRAKKIQNAGDKRYQKLV